MPHDTPDITVHDHGSIILFRAASPVGKAWIEEYVSREGYQPLPSGTRVVEPRYLQPIIDGAVDAQMAAEGRR